jgi:prepilin-type N-terminal cleavage/methylation domain-containing protein
MTSPLHRPGAADGFSLVELLLALALLSLAIGSIGASSLRVMTVERELLTESSTWRLARAIGGLHRAGEAPEKLAAYAERHRATLQWLPLGDEESSPDGWARLELRLAAGPVVSLPVVAALPTRPGVPGPVRPRNPLSPPTEGISPPAARL